VYPNERVVQFVNQHFIPVRIHVREQADEWKRVGGRYGVQWTPTILVVDPSGEERHRIEGFLPTDDFLAQLELGWAHEAFGTGQFDEAAKRFRAVVDHHPNTDAAPEALYWAGVSRYKATNDAAALADTAKAFKERYQGSTWAKKSTVWGS
jgi:thioredoxin family protein/tetratricopeptide repeat protein